MKNIYGYIRVSTKKQGDGVSLEVQKEDIIRYAKANNLNIIEWFEEKKSASKGYRPKFSSMIENLYNKEADGFIAHKIDRMMRNRNDWATINDLMDEGSLIISADGVNMDDVAGRFMGDIQAAVATNYSSNLSRESKKGLYGRLKQEYYPFKAPVGYINNGGGKTKTLDTIKAPLVKQLFELYTNKGFVIRTLVDEMYKRGLRNTRGNKVSKNSMIRILKNPYYTGIMEIKKKQYKGNHNPIITMMTYKKVQDIMSGKTNTKIRKHDFMYRRMLNCKGCSYKLIGELQKGNVYYRCHSKHCPTKSVRETTVDLYVNNLLKTIRINKEEVSVMEDKLLETRHNWLESQKKLLHSINLRLGSLDDRLQKITDLLIESVLDREQYESQKQKILAQRQELNEHQNLVSTKKMQFLKKMQDFLELAKKPNILYELANIEEKRELLENLTSNLQIDGKRVMFSMVPSFYELANRDVLMFGGDNNTTTLNKACTIVYSDKNTSPIVPTPLDETRCKEFFEHLLEDTTALPNINLPNTYEIPTNYSST
ncbi:recombinase family protein [Olleya sp. AH-315-K02]|nr:recombinase family protein [bacterium AH-315-P13]MBN4057915.1 recombinase family protein [Olleya sp. AH-315-K02]